MYGSSRIVRAGVDNAGQHGQAHHNPDAVAAVKSEHRYGNCGEHAVDRHKPQRHKHHNANGERESARGTKLQSKQHESHNHNEERQDGDDQRFESLDQPLRRRIAAAQSTGQRCGVRKASHKEEQRDEHENPRERPQETVRVEHVVHVQFAVLDRYRGHSPVTKDHGAQRKAAQQIGEAIALLYGLGAGGRSFGAGHGDNLAEPHGAAEVIPPKHRKNVQLGAPDISWGETTSSQSSAII